MTYKIVHDQRVVDFVSSRIGMKNPGMVYPVGLDKDGTIVAGAIYERGNSFNVFMHGAIDTIVTRAYLRELFAYPFKELGVKRVTVMPPSTNVKAISWDMRVGFVREAKMKGAAWDGSDLEILVMWKEDCRWLGSD